MKNKQIFTLLILIMTSCKSCDKNNDATPSEQLPAATQEGKNTFGCLIDGKVFVPGGGGLFGSPILVCAYQFIDGGYYFQLHAKNKSNAILTSISINSNNDKPKIGSTILLGKWIQGQWEAKYLKFENLNENFMETDSTFLGELTFSKFDTINQIASGTFWFDVFDSTANAKVQIREGRFDVPFTR